MASGWSLFGYDEYDDYEHCFESAEPFYTEDEEDLMSEVCWLMFNPKVWDNVRDPSQKNLDLTIKFNRCIREKGVKLVKDRLAEVIIGCSEEFRSTTNIRLAQELIKDLEEKPKRFDNPEQLIRDALKRQRYRDDPLRLD